MKMPSTLDLKLWRWHVTVRVRCRPIPNSRVTRRHLRRKTVSDRADGRVFSAKLPITVRNRGHRGANFAWECRAGDRRNCPEQLFRAMLSAFRFWPCWQSRILKWRPVTRLLGPGLVSEMPKLDQQAYGQLVAANRARYGAPAGEGERVEPQPVLAPQGKRQGKGEFELGAPDLL
jgi:hypothetical protein